jgi:hypothetical protein
MAHLKECMCDECIKGRVRQRIADDKAKAEAKRIEDISQDYIRRRGGVDPRRSK